MQLFAKETDEALAALVQEKNDAAFGILMNRYQAKLLRYGKRFLSGDAPIEDVVQDVFIKTYQNIKSYDPVRPFSPWIYRIAHNEFVNALRQKSRLSFITIDLDTISAHHAYEIDPAGDEDRREAKVAVEQGLAALTPLYREVLVLYYIEELSYQEIADVLHVPIGTVGIRLHRARQQLKKYVKHP